MRKIVLIATAFAVIASTAIAGPREDLLSADRAFSQLSVDKGSNAANLAFMADDVRLYGTGNQNPIFGKPEAIKRFQTSGNGDPKLNVLSWDPDGSGVAKDGTLGWTDSHWVFETGPDDYGRRHHLTGHYLTVWTKDAKGAWKVQSNMATSDPSKK
jgi:ketosteroid isomerase-like protein